MVLGYNVGGKEGKTMELPKQPFSVDVAGVKEEYRRAKLSGARNFDVSGATCSLRWYFPEEERMMRYSRGKYFPQLRTKVINPVGEPSKIL
jgi:hypothetical protein